MTGTPEPTAPGGWRWPHSRTKIALVVAIVLAVFLGTRFLSGGSGMGCLTDNAFQTQWDQPAAGVLLANLWSRGTESIEAADAELTHLTVIWANDGSIFRAELQGITPQGQQITLSTARLGGSETITVYSNAYLVGTSTTSATPTSEGAGSPGVAEILTSIDSVGFEGFKKATSTVPGEDEGFMLKYSPATVLPASETVADVAHASLTFNLAEGALTPLDGTTLLSSLGPVLDFVLWKAELRGSTSAGMEPPLAFLFVP